MRGFVTSGNDFKSDIVSQANPKLAKERVKIFIRALSSHAITTGRVLKKIGGHSIPPKTTSANALSASPLPPNEKSHKRQSSYRLGQVKLD